MTFTILAYLSFLQLINAVFFLYIYRPNIYDDCEVINIETMPSDFKYKYCVKLSSNDERFDYFTNKSFNIGDKITFENLNINVKTIKRNSENININPKNIKKYKKILKK